MDNIIYENKMNYGGENKGHITVGVESTLGGPRPDLLIIDDIVENIDYPENEIEMLKTGKERLE